MKKKRFTDCNLPMEFPQQDVAEHEVFITFTNAADADFFREWWQDVGSWDFNRWLGREDQ